MRSNTSVTATLSLYAALNVKSGKVHGKTAARHTRKEFAISSTKSSNLAKAGQEIHIIVDNLSAHKTKTVAEFLETHPGVTLHFTPTYSSLLNQVETWLSCSALPLEVHSDVRGVFVHANEIGATGQ